MLRPRLTIRRLMCLVAAVSVLIGVISAQARRERRQSSLDRRRIAEAFEENLEILSESLIRCMHARDGGNGYGVNWDKELCRIKASITYERETEAQWFLMERERQAGRPELSEVYELQAKAHARDNRLFLEWDAAGRRMSAEQRLQSEASKQRAKTTRGPAVRGSNPFSPANRSSQLIGAAWSARRASEHGQFARNSRARALYHARMRRKYEYAASHHWEPIPPDPPAPVDGWPAPSQRGPVPSRPAGQSTEPRPSDLRRWSN